MNADKRWENAAERCRKAANSYYNRGLVRARERDLSGAAPLLKRALELDKTHMEARNLLGLVFYESGEVGDALVQWVISMGLQPENNPAIRYLDDIRRKSGRIRTYARQIQRYNAALNEQGGTLEIEYVVDFDHAFVGTNTLHITIQEQRGNEHGKQD